MKTDSNESLLLTKEKSIIVHEERGKEEGGGGREGGGRGEREDGSQLTIKCISSSSVTKNLLVNG